MSSVIIAENCKKVSVVDVLDLEKTVGTADYKRGLLDMRHNMFTINNTGDKEMYFNYLRTINEIAQESRFGRYNCLLDLGYIPILMVPMFIGDRWDMQFIQALERNGIPYKKLPASSFSKDSYTADSPDIWVSKLDCADIVGKPAHLIRSIDVINRIGCF